ncbi:MAG: helix-turn-helix domain-containing protein [Lachnospiraceae bacterium]
MRNVDKDRIYYDIIKSGQRLRKLRAEKGLTQETAASYIGMSIAGYKKIEYGNNGARVDTLLMLAKLYGVSLDYIVYGREEWLFDVILEGQPEAVKKYITAIIKSILDNLDILKDSVKEENL